MISLRTQNGVYNYGPYSYKTDHECVKLQYIMATI